MKKMDLLGRKVPSMCSGFTVIDSMRNNKTYGGTTLKFGITVDSIDYIVKFPKDGSISSIFSEFVASTFITELGFNAHIVYLGVYKNGGYRTPVVILRDFTDKFWTLKSFDAIHQSSEDTDIYGHKSYTYHDILYLLDKNTKILSESKFDYCVRFWTTFILDAILGNRDRHGGNWGYLTDGLVYKEAPIYDNGSSLFPDVEKVIDSYELDRKRFLEERSNYFPASIIKRYDENGIARRINYFDALNFLVDDTYFMYAMDDFNHSVNLDKIVEVAKFTKEISRSAGISDNYLEFYESIIIARYLRMIMRYDVGDACEKALSLVGN